MFRMFLPMFYIVILSFLVLFAYKESIKGPHAGSHAAHTG
jgi:hypothetical protein